MFHYLKNQNYIIKINIIKTLCILKHYCILKKYPNVNYMIRRDLVYTRWLDSRELNSLLSWSLS